MKNVKRLIGAQGTTFDSSFVSFSLCCPSRSTFLTGQYAHNHGVTANTPPEGGYYNLDHSNTLAVWLQRSGYYTALVGKYLNEYGKKNPREIPPGWSEWFATVDPTTYDYLSYDVNENGTVKTHGGAKIEYMTDVLGQRAVDVIRRRARSKQPFFLWLTFTAPHYGLPRDRDDLPLALPGSQPWPASPYPPRRYRDRFRSVALPKTPAFDEADVSDKPAFIRQLPRFPEHSQLAIREAYDQQLESLLAVDEAVGRVMKALSKAHALGRTVVVFTSDNGYLNGEHRVPAGKIYAYEPSIRVPLMIRGPGIPRGRHRRQIVANIDLAPTIVALTGARPGRVMDGSSLLPVIRDPNRGTDRALLLERGPEGLGPLFTGIRTPRFKYVDYADGEEELYDLSVDPAELTNLAADPAEQQVKAELRRRLELLRHCSGLACRS
jgi:arylsulfatase A-like enzyme